MTFSWINDDSITQTCCWSVTNARIIELNNGGNQPGNTATVLLGDMCISGTSYECTDNTTWLCSESSLSQTPPTVELRSNSFTLGESASDVSVNSNCSSNNNIPSTNPPGLISCDILTPSSSSSSTQQTTSTSTISSDTSMISSTSVIGTILSTATISSTTTSVIRSTPSSSLISSDISMISSDTSMISSTSVISSTATISSTITSVISTIPSSSLISSDISMISSTSTISSDTSMISSDTSTISSDTSTISSTSVISFVTTQSPSPSNINLQTCNSDGELWSQTPVGTNATGIGACYNGTVNGELLIMTDRNTD